MAAYHCGKVPACYSLHLPKIEPGFRQRGPVRIAGVLGNWAFKIRNFTEAEQSQVVATRAKSLPALPGRKLYIVLLEWSESRKTCLIASFHSME